MVPSQIYSGIRDSSLFLIEVKYGNVASNGGVQDIVTRLPSHGDRFNNQNAS
jgi:hypothetical protein